MAEQKKYDFFSRLWIKESGLSSMLLLLFIMQFVIIPLFGDRSYFLIMINIFWMLFLISGVFVLARNKKQAIWISIFPFLFLVCQWINLFNKNILIEFIDFSLTIITLFLLIVLVLKKVFEPGPVNAHRIIGSIVVYMLLANVWGILYLFLFNQIEGSFQLTETQFKINSELANFMYFSYITITSTGFGEIVPIHPIARSLVQVEALTGILYPVVLIGRLVSDSNFSPNKNS